MMETKDKSSGIMFSCTHCEKVFKYNSEKTRHEISHLQNFECDLCNKKFGYISALRRHKKQHERTNSVKCEECNRKFRDEALLQRHIKYAHKGTFSCSKCSSTFSSDLALRTHQKTHKPVAERRFKCSHQGCEKSFNFSHHLKHHELTHSNEKQHFCTVCGKGFIQSHHLKAHLKNHNPSEWLHCDFKDCSKKFSTEYAKKRHMSTTHKNKPDSGISSDSNSCDASIKSNETFEDYIEDKAEIIELQGTIIPSNNSSISGSPNHVQVPGSPIDSNVVVSNIELKVDAISAQNDELETDIGDCKLAIGSCIAKDNCICEEINKSSKKLNIGNVTEKISIVKPIENSIEKAVNNGHVEYLHKLKQIKNDVNSKNAVSLVKKQFKISNNNYGESNACEGCECASICTEEDRAICNNTRTPNNLPNIENTNGVIKLKDTFDIDFKIRNFKNESFMSFSTCKDVIGKCIVEGDGCLCARMIEDEQQAMAQEIDDITPQPKTD